MTTTYAVHDFVRVEVGDGIGRQQAASIQTQLSGFRRTQPSQARAVLQVRPYEEFRRGARAVQARRDVYVSGRGIDFARERWALEIEPGRVGLYFGGRSQPVNPYIQWLVASQGVSLVHAAAVEREGRALLVPAFGGAGKTAISATLARREGVRFLGDDVVLLSREGAVYAFPRALILYPHHREVFPDYFEARNTSMTVSGAWTRVRRAAWRNLPLKPLARSLARRLHVEDAARSAVSTHEYLAAVAPDEILGAGKTGTSASVGTVLQLERADVESPSVAEADAGLLARRMFAVIHHEWAAHWEPLLVAGGAGLVDLPSYYASVAETIESAVSSASVRQSLTVPYAFPGGRLPEMLPDAW